MKVKDTILKALHESIEAKVEAEVTAVVVEDAPVVDAPVVVEAPVLEAKDKENEKFTDKIDGDEKDDLCEAVDPAILEDAMLSVDEALTESEKLALFEGIDLPEEVKANVVVAFEAAVMSRAKKKVMDGMDKTIKSYSKKMKENTIILEKKTKEKMKEVSKKWMQENQVALENNIRTHLAESFMAGLKDLFESHYIDIPVAKQDLVAALQEKINKLEEGFASKDDELQSLKESLENQAREKILKESTGSLSDIQVEKVNKLMEGLKFESQEDFKSKLSQIKESVVAVKSEDKVITENAKEVVKDVKSENAEIALAMKAYHK